MSGNICVISGIASNPDTRSVLVLYRNKKTGEDVLLGRTHTVGIGGGFVPPGVKKGQFRLTLIVPPEYATEDIHLVDDRGTDGFLSDVSIAMPSAVSEGALVEITPTLVSAGPRGTPQDLG